MPELGEELYLSVAYSCAQTLTKSYSTSFGISILLLDADIRPHIRAVYGMVRLADEIVDTFDEDRALNLARFKRDVFEAVTRRFSSNLLLHAFQHTYHAYGLEPGPVEAFFASMEMDLVPTEFTEERFDAYVYGSAECIGLMCLPVFLRGDRSAYEALEPSARRLGAGYQKINFLRDIRDDFETRGRSYFPGIVPQEMTLGQKQAIEEDIRQDFALARTALAGLPPDAARATRLSIRYYEELLRKISRVSAQQLMRERIRVSTLRKAGLLAFARLRAR